MCAGESRNEWSEADFAAHRPKFDLPTNPATPTAEDYWQTHLISERRTKQKKEASIKPFYFIIKKTDAAKHCRGFIACLKDFFPSNHHIDQYILVKTRFWPLPFACARQPISCDRPLLC